MKMVASPRRKTSGASVGFKASTMCGLLRRVRVNCGRHHVRKGVWNPAFSHTSHGREREHSSAPAFISRYRLTRTCAGGSRHGAKHDVLWPVATARVILTARTPGSKEKDSRKSELLGDPEMDTVAAAGATNPRSSA